MNKTKALRTEVYTVLNALLNGNLGERETATPIYYQQAQTSPPKKYIVYTVDEVSRADGRIVYELEINCMDYGTDTGAAEDLADNIQAAFDKLVRLTDDIAVYFYAGQRNTVTEEDRNIIRRRLTFDTYLYERG